ncbi:MAG: c-type cytochrome [Balneolaceae bacterium]|nr:c-type cytochrome [Balneolaceae bacterium]
MLKRDFGFLLISVLTLLLLISCRSRERAEMHRQEERAMQAVYDSVEHDFKDLMQAFETGRDTMPAEIQQLYDQMLLMHGRMDRMHQQMMGEGDHMMGRGMEQPMPMHRQTRMSRDWYQQMMSMHESMMVWHRGNDHQEMADRHRRMMSRYQSLLRAVPEDEETAVSGEERGTGAETASVNGEQIFVQQCASCHGSDGMGSGTVFPPLINSEWIITQNISIPVRILLHGLSGEIEVQGRTYRGSMPSFGARLSDAEVAAVINHLRKRSDAQAEPVTAEEVAGIAKKFSDRETAWSAEELQSDLK